MEYQKILNLLDNAPAGPAKLSTKNELKRMMTHVERIAPNSHFKISMLKSSLCDYSDAYILVSGTIITAPVPLPPANLNNNDKEVGLKYCTSLTDFISENKQYANRCC